MQESWQQMSQSESENSRGDQRPSKQQQIFPIDRSQELQSSRSSKKSPRILVLAFEYLKPQVTAQLLYQKISRWWLTSCPCKIHWIKIWNTEQGRTPHANAEIYLSELACVKELEYLLSTQLPHDVSDLFFQGGPTNFYTKYKYTICKELKPPNEKNRIYQEDSQLVLTKCVQFGNILSSKSRKKREDFFFPRADLSNAIIECDATGIMRIHVNNSNGNHCDQAEFLVSFNSQQCKMMEIQKKSIVGTAVCVESAGNSVHGVLFEIAHPPFLYCQSPANQENFSPLASFVRPLNAHKNQTQYSSDPNKNSVCNNVGQTSVNQSLLCCDVEEVGDDVRWQWIRIDDSISKYQTIGDSFSVAVFFESKQQYSIFSSWMEQAKLISPKSTKLGEQMTVHPYSEERVLKSKERINILMQKLPLDVSYLLGFLVGTGRLVFESLDEQLVDKRSGCILNKILEDLCQGKDTPDEDSCGDIWEEEVDYDGRDDKRLENNAAVICKVLESFCSWPKRILEPRAEYIKKSMEMTFQIVTTPWRRHKSKWKYPVGKILVTPTRIIPQLKQVETTNRIIRDYFEFADRFIRVQFGDENEEMLWGKIKQGEDLEQRFRHILRNGITIGDRHFQWLHFSNSGLRMHSAWFFAPCPHLSRQQIWGNLGDFSNLRSIPKYAARVGQCFSTTVPTIDILPYKEFQIIQQYVLADLKLQEDLQSDLHNHPYSDGCGLISIEAAEQIALKHPSLKGNRSFPCAYQIRYGGCKGMVCAWPGQSNMALRKSMMKFECEHRVVEVCQQAQFMTAYLNRQIIILLVSRGVHSSIFLDLLQKEWELLQKIVTNRSVALSILSRYGNSSKKELLTCISDLLECEQMTDILKVPFVRGQLELVRAVHFNDMKSYARILVDDAVRLLGVVDETGLLQDGEVFLQIQRDENEMKDAHTRIITGKVMITRNPCLFPGDIRVANAVDVPELGHLVNVLVFNAKQTGTLVTQQSMDNPRLYRTSETPVRVPLQHMCSGGDLDGDDYFVTWNPKLFPPVQDEVGLQYPDVQVVMKDGPITPEDCQDHFLNFMSSSNVGQICNAHLVIADANLQQAPEKLQQPHEQSQVYKEDSHASQPTFQLFRSNFGQNNGVSQSGTVESKLQSNLHQTSQTSSRYLQRDGSKQFNHQQLDQLEEITMLQQPQYVQNNGSIKEIAHQNYNQLSLLHQHRHEQFDRITSDQEQLLQKEGISWEKQQQLWEVAENFQKQLKNSNNMLGAWHPHCVKLAIEAEKAFGFGKTGVPAELPRDLIPTIYPHYMEKAEKKMYQSTSVLGLMYNQLTQCESPKVPNPENLEESFRLDFDLVLDNDPMFQQFLSRAHELQEKYADEIDQLMGRYGIQSELELCSGFVMELGNKVDRQKNVTARANLLAEFKEQQRFWRNEFERMPDVLSETRERISQLKLVQASAWFCSVYHPQYRMEHDQPKESFAWIPYQYLIRIKQSFPGNVILNNIYIVTEMGGVHNHFKPKKAEELFRALSCSQLVFYWDGNCYKVVSELQLNPLGIFVEGDQKVTFIQTSQNKFFIAKDIWKNLNSARKKFLGLKQLSDLDLKKDFRMV